MIGELRKMWPAFQSSVDIPSKSNNIFFGRFKLQLGNRKMNLNGDRTKQEYSLEILSRLRIGEKESGRFVNESQIKTKRNFLH